MALFSLDKEQYSYSGSGDDIPLWIKLGFTTLAVVVFVVYWDYLGPANYLWFSDIALFLLVPALWFGNRLLASTMAVAVLIPELIWVFDFLTLSYFSILANYMFDSDMSLGIRILSGAFHFAIPAVLLYMLYNFGYDQRALPLQCLLALVVLPFTYLVSEPEANINWVYGPFEPQDTIHPWLYLMLLWLAMVSAIYIPSHLVFKRFFSKCRLADSKRKHQSADV